MSKTSENNQKKGVSRDQSNSDSNKQRPNPNDPNQREKQPIGDKDEKGRKEQVLAKINDNPEREDNDEGEDSSQITNKDNKITNAPREDDSITNNKNSTRNSDSRNDENNSDSRNTDSKSKKKGAVRERV